MFGFPFHSPRSGAAQDPTVQKQGPKARNSSPRKRRYRWGIPLLGAAVLASGLAFTPSANLFEVTKNLDIYTAVYRELNTYYVDDVDPNKLMREGIDAMLESLDPYTSYISEAEMEGHRFQMTGRYGGIGAIIRTMDGDIVVMEPYADFPADKAGLQAGDILLEIDGKSTEGKNTSDISDILRGAPGSEMLIKFRRPFAGGTEEGQQMEVTLTREDIEVGNVPYYGMVGERIGYIRLTQFTQDAGKNVADALRQLKEDASASGEGELRGVVLDLRGNPGGLLREAVNVSNVFIPKGELIVSTQGKVKEWDRDFKTLNQPVDTEIPVVVLTSRASASASEIVAGVIQDYDRGLVVGARTFGKGLVQSTRDVPYKTKLKVTTAKYYTPSGRCIQAIDYAHRNDDGSVGKIPDSLQSAFQTRAGRTVYDGGGVTPDVKTDPGEYADVTIALMRKNHFFKYATRYRAEHEAIGDPMTWTISDDAWADFRRYVEGVELDYTTQTEDLLEELRESAEDEKYLDAIGADLEALEAKLGHDKKADVEQFSEEIRNELESEIVGRYYLQRGAIETSFRYDTDLQKALELFDDQPQFTALLDPSVVVGDDVEVAPAGMIDGQ